MASPCFSFEAKTYVFSQRPLGINFIEIWNLRIYFVGLCDKAHIIFRDKKHKKETWAWNLYYFQFPISCPFVLLLPLLQGAMIMNYDYEYQRLITTNAYNDIA
jgi:hypothetical protein